MRKKVLGLAFATIFILNACSATDDSKGDTSAGDAQEILVSAEGDGVANLSYTELGDGTVLVEMDCGDGDGDCNLEVNQVTGIDKWEHTDDATGTCNQLGGTPPDEDGNCPIGFYLCSAGTTCIPE